MSRKRNRRKRQAGVGQLDRVKRQLEKGNAKQALKEAKACFRKEASASHRQVLQQAYAARIEELHRAGHHDQARALLGELLELGVTEPLVQDRLPRLQVLLGISKGGSAVQGELLRRHPELLPLLADQAVLRPQQTRVEDAQMRRQAAEVRGALEQIEQGEDQAAADRLSGVPRQSPFADWKLFARGLSAYYNGQRDRMRSNWQRLAGGRAASRIAEVLMVLCGEKRAEELSTDRVLALRRLEGSIQVDAPANHIKRLASAAKDGDWEEFCRRLRPFRQQCSRSHRELLARVVEVAWKRMVREGEERAARRLIRVAPAPALDPKWNRALALLAEHPRQANADPVEAYWVRYAADLESVEVLSKEEKAIARGLVYLRLARDFACYARELEEPDFGALFEPPDPEEVDWLRQAAARYFRQSLQIYPQLRDAYRELARLLMEMDEPGQAVAAYVALVRRYPDDYDALVWLAEHFHERERPDKAERYARAAYQLKPRDPGASILMWNQHVAMARLCAKKGIFTVARQEIAAAAELPAAPLLPYVLHAMRAALEYKAQNEADAGKYLQLALSCLREPTPVWLIMSYWAARFGLSKQIKKDFNDRLKATVKQKGNSQTAGHLAGFLGSQLVSKLKYPGRVTHRRLVISYLKRCSRVRWDQTDLRNVCNFLMLGGDEQGLCTKLLSIGTKRFSGDPHFHFWLGQSEVSRGPFRCKIGKARRSLERAVQLAHASDPPLPDRWLNQAKRALAMLEYTEQHAPPPLACPDDDDEFVEGDTDWAEGRFAPRGPFGGLPELDFSDLEELLPPEMLDELEALAELAGIDAEELVRRVGRGGARPAPVAGSTAGRSKPRGRTKARTRRRKARTKK